MPKSNAPRDPEKRKQDEELDRELENTFPASDPPSVTQPSPREPEQSEQRPA